MQAKNRIDLRVFCWNIPCYVDFISAWTEICKNCWNVIFFQRQQIFSRVSLRGSLVCSLTVPVLFSHRIFDFVKSIDELWQSIATLPSMLVRIPVSLPRQYWLKISLITSENQKLRYASSFNYVLIMYIMCCIIFAVNDTNGASSQILIDFRHGCNTLKNKRFYTRKDACKKPNKQFTRVTSCLPVKNRYFHLSVHGKHLRHNKRDCT